jgi:hypothetical protein
MGTADDRDPGLQPERTVMAWQRTILSLAGATLISLRMYFPRIDSWAIAAVVSSVITLEVLWILASRRQQHTLDSFPLADLHHRGRAATRPLTPGGRTLALLAVTTSGGSATALLHMLSARH